MPAQWRLSPATPGLWELAAAGRSDRSAVRMLRSINIIQAPYNFSESSRYWLWTMFTL